MPAPMNRWRWWTIALRGLAAVVLGILGLLAPQLALLSLVLAFGVFAIADGVLALALAPAGRQHWPLVVRGAISIVAGVVAIAMPGITAFALLVLVGVWAIASGIVEIALAVRLREQLTGEWLLALEGGLSIVFGICLLVSPLAGAIVIGLWIGAYALVLGGMMLASALRVRRWRQGPPWATSTA